MPKLRYIDDPTGKKEDFDACKVLVLRLWERILIMRER